MARMVPAKSIESLRNTKTANQKYVCPICKGSLAHGLNALDHCHKTGHIRSVLCNSCNVGEGKVKAAMQFRTPKGNMAWQDQIQWLRRLARYLEYHQDNPSGLIHPTFDLKTGKQKVIKRKTNVRKPNVRKTAVRKASVRRSRKTN